MWIKRDDACSPVYGGNKVRKLEFLLAEAMRRERRSIVTVGGIGSNHVVATGLFARQLGLKTHAVLVPQPVTPQVRRTLDLCLSLETEILPCSSRFLVPCCLAKARRLADRPYVIGPGGSSPLGTLGYVSAGLELGEQIREQSLPEPDDVFIPLGSGGSATGLLIGLALSGLSCRVIGVRVVERLLVNATWVRFLRRRTERLLLRSGLPVPLPRPRPLSVWHRHFGGEYGRVTREAEAAVRLARDTEGLELDTTYTGKTLAALLDYCRGPGRGRRALFWNTHNSRDTSDLLRYAASTATLPPRVKRWLGDPVRS